MYKREIEIELKQLAQDYLVVTITGPRQSGKTTLVRKMFPNKPYANLEAPDTRHLAETDPRAFLNQFPDGAIFDEIQRTPPLLSYIQTIVDEKKIRGMFILTGSHQLKLHQAVSQSLAGRTALLFLLPMSLSELSYASIQLTLDEALYTGGFPGIYQQQLAPTKAYRNYLQTYIERDLRELIQVKDLIQFQEFIRLCAGRVGQLINYESLANDVGASSSTIKHWLSILEASFIIIRLRPYFENFGKRIIKSPKLYFADVGLACYLLGIKSAEHASRDPLRGNLVENLILLELVKSRFNKGLDPDLYYYRDTHGHEVDFIFQNGRTLVPIEVKAAQTFNSRLMKHLQAFKKLVGARCAQGYLIYAGEHEQQIDLFQLLNYQRSSHILDIYT